MGCSEFLDTLGVTGAVADGTATFVWCKYFGYFVKIVVAIFEITCGGITLHRSRLDLEVYKVDPNITVKVGHPTFNSTVNVDVFEASFNWFCVFYAFDIIVTTTMMIYQINRSVEKKSPKVWTWIPVALLVELPMIVCETQILMSRRIIDFHEQMYDMMLHVIFVLNLPFQTICSIWMALKISWESLCIGVFISPLCFLLSCMIYMPVSITMVGAKAFNKITLEDFGDVILTGPTKDIMLILATFGHIGQVLWTVLFIAGVCTLIIYWNKKDD